MHPEQTRRLLMVCRAPTVLTRLKSALHEFADTAAVAGDAEEALERLESQSFDIIVFHAAGAIFSATDLLVHLRAEDVETGMVLVVDHALVPDAVSAMRSGCLNLLETTEIETSLRAAVVHGLQKTMLARAADEQRRSERTSLRLAESRVRALDAEIAELQQSTVDALLAALDPREPGTRTHSARVAAYASYIARSVNYPANLMEHLHNACMLHDIGKIELPMEALQHPGILPASQLEVLRPHALLGERLLNNITFLRPAARIVRHHHERWDGSGYPDKLAGENIPLGARILSIADTLDAITNEQTYRPAQTFEEAIEEICRWTRRQFDPVLISELRKIPVTVWTQVRREVEGAGAPAEHLPRLVA